MPFTGLTQGIRAVLKQWGTLMGYAGMGARAATVRQTLDEVPGETPELSVLDEMTAQGATWNDFQQVFALANANERAAGRFMAASPDAPFDPAWAGVTPASRTPAARAASPTIRVRVNYTYLDDTGELVNDWFTTTLSVTEGLTKTAILSRMETLLATTLQTTTTARRTYHGTLVGINTVRLTWI